MLDQVPLSCEVFVTCWACIQHVVVLLIDVPCEVLLVVVRHCTFVTFVCSSHLGKMFCFHGNRAERGENVLVY